MIIAVLLHLLCCDIVASAYFPSPHVHLTPADYRRVGWHDIAGAHQHPLTKAYHLFVGPGWGHAYSSNLVDWTLGPDLHGMGGSGTLIYYDHQRNLSVAVTGTVSQFTNESPDLTAPFTSCGAIFRTVDPVNIPTNSTGCWDPVIWWDERVSLWYAMGACGHNGNGGMGGGGGYGLQLQFEAATIDGPWTELPSPFLEWHTEQVPHVGRWNRSHTGLFPF